MHQFRLGVCYDFRNPPDSGTANRTLYAEIMERSMRVLGIAPDDPALIRRRVDFGPPPSETTRWAYAPNVAPAASLPAGVVQ